MGISAGIASLLSTIGSGVGAVGTAAASGLGALGVGSETAGIIGSGLSSAIGGAGIGAGEAALTGGNIGAGALGGGLSFGLGDIGGAVAPSLGLGAGAGSALGGAVGGTAAAGLEGSNLGTGALTGALGGLGEHAIGSPSTWGAPAGGAGAAATAPSASGISLPGGANPADLTAGGGLGGGAGGALTTPGTQLTANVPGIGGGSSALGGVGVTPNQLTGSFASGGAPAAVASPGIGSDVANSLGLGPKTGAFLDNHGGQILQGGIMGAEGLQQRSEENKLLGPLKEQAAGFANQGQALSGALFGGQLPAGAQDAVSLATQSAKARTKSTYAQLGLSGSTMEADALGEIDRQASAQTFQFANELLQSGMKDSQMSSELYGGILQTQLSQDKALQEAIANFSAQLMGGQAQPGGKAI